MKRRRVYSQKKYGNPFFRKRRKVRRISLRVKLIIFLVILMIVGIGWLLFFHSFFTINNIEISGGQRIEEKKIREVIQKQLLETRLMFFNQSNIFTFNKEEARQEIIKRYNVEDLRINKRLPKTIAVSFVEKTIAGIWFEKDKYYYIDDGGYILYEIETLEAEAKDFAVFKNKGEETKIKQDEIFKKVVMRDDFLDFLLILAKKVKEKAVFNQNYIFTINETESTIEINIIEGPTIYFNIEENLDKQSRKLEILLSEKLKGEEFKKIEYIDLRFGDKIYYK